MTIWYSTGTATFTNGSTTVTGSGTSWNAQGVARPGYAMHGPDGNVYEITAVASDTSMTIAPAYLGATVSGADYRIQPTGGPVVDLLTRVDQLLSDFEAAVNGPLAGRHPDGTLSALALSFAADQDTGFWRKASGTVGFAANGSETVEMGPGGLTVTGALSGTAITQSQDDTTTGRLLVVGSRGIGGAYNNDEESLADQFAYGCGAIGWGSSSGGGPSDAPISQGCMGFQAGSFPDRGVQILARGQGALAGNRLWFRGLDSTWASWAEVYHDGNTTVDGSGFILEASPIVRLYHDRIEEPNAPVGATMERVGTGHYVLTGCPPMATEGWQTRDAVGPSGEVIASLGAPVWIDGALHVQTYIDGRRADLPEGAFAMLRFWEAKTEGDAPPEPVQLTADEGAEHLLDEARNRAEMDRVSFAIAAAEAGYIDYDEAAQWAAGNAIPPAVATVLDTLSEQEKGPATVDVLARPRIRRTGNLMPAIAAAFGTDDAGLDALFGI